MERPLHGLAREDILMNVSTQVFEAIGSAVSSQDRLLAVLGSHCQADWEHIGRFIGRVRQARRQARRIFEHMQQVLNTRGFDVFAAAWRSKGRFVCRHGLLFHRAPATVCRCMVQPGSDEPAAKFMPALDANLRRIIAIPFDRDRFRRIG